MGDLLTDMMNMARPNPSAIIYQDTLRGGNGGIPSSAADASGSVPPAFLNNQAAPSIASSASASPVADVPDAAPLTSGRSMEGKSRQSIDDILSGLYGAQKQQEGKDSNLAWMQFFSKMASSPSSSFLGAAGAGANALSDTMLQQETARRQNAQSLGVADIKQQEFQQEQALKKEQIEMGKYSVTPDGMGGFLKMDTKTGETTPISSAMANSMNIAKDANGNALTGDDFLKTLDPRVAVLAKEIANGDRPYPTGFALKNPLLMQAEIAARQYDPTANGNRFPAVAKFNTGPQGNQVRSFNVGIAHLATLSTLVDALDNGDVKMVNTAANAYKGQTGDPAPTNFNAAREVVGNEIVKAIVGAGGGVGDREKAQQAVNAANSPAQLKGAIQTYKSLMRGQLQGLQKQYEDSTGRKDFTDRLLPEARAEFQSSSAAPIASAPQDRLAQLKAALAQKGAQ